MSDDPKMNRIKTCLQAARLLDARVHSNKSEGLAPIFYSHGGKNLTFRDVISPKEF